MKGRVVRVDPRDVKSYWENRFSEDVSLATVGWLGLGPAFNAWMYRVRRVQFLRLLRRYVGKHDAVLDIGSGSGFYLDRWRELGVASITGSDLTETATEQLREKYDVPIVCLDIGDEKMPLDGAFDAISAMDVLFHIVDDDRYARALRNVSSLLSDRGVFVFTDNFLHAGEMRAAHQASRTFEAIDRCLHDAGLAIVERHPSFVLMNTPVDTNSPILLAHWSLLRRVLGRFPRLAGLAGAMLFPLEVLLVGLLKEGPSTEIVICRKASTRRAYPAQLIAAWMNTSAASLHGRLKSFGQSV